MWKKKKEKLIERLWGDDAECLVMEEAIQSIQLPDNVGHLVSSMEAHVYHYDDPASRPEIPRAISTLMLGVQKKTLAVAARYSATGGGNPQLKFYASDLGEQVAKILHALHTPEQVKEVLEKLSGMNPTDNSGGQNDPFNLSVDSPIITPMLLKAYKNMTELSPDPVTGVVIVAFQAHGYNCAIHMVETSDQGIEKYFDHGMSPSVVIQFIWNNLRVTLPYDPGAVYSAAKIMKKARARVIEALDDTQGSVTYLVRDDNRSMQSNLQSACMSCGRSARESTPAERVRIAATYYCSKCTELHNRLGDYKNEEGVVPSV